MITIPDETAAHVLWQADRGGYPAGSFTTALLAAWNLADDDNHCRLSTVFPDYGAALDLLRQPGGVERLRVIAEGGRSDG